MVVASLLVALSGLCAGCQAAAGKTPTPSVVRALREYRREAAALVLLCDR